MIRGARKDLATFFCFKIHKYSDAFSHFCLNLPWEEVLALNLGLVSFECYALCYADTT